MDGLLLDTEDLYTLCINLILEKYQRPKLPWSIKAKLQGRPGPQANAIFHEWSQLPIDREEYIKQLYALQREHFPGTQPLPGIPKLLSDLGRTRYWDEVKKEQVLPPLRPDDATTSAPQRVHIALATSSHEANFRLKTAHLTELFSVFEAPRRVLGDDKRIPAGRGKPLPDIYHLALRTINDSLPAGERPILPEECLVFEDSVPGVESGRRAGMRVIWCPHPMLKREYSGREEDVLAGLTGEAGHGVDEHQLGERGDGWAEHLETLVDFPYARYGIQVPPVAVESEECMRTTGRVADGEVMQVVGQAP